MSKKRSRSPSEDKSSIFKSRNIEDRESTFVGIYSRTIPAKELQKLPEYKSASHRMIGWRKPSTQQTLNARTGATQKVIYTTGYDDDGEKYGGKRIEKVLNELNVEGSVMVVRWYGGTLLGPVRFTHIEDVAREAIFLWKESVAPATKKVKADDVSEAEQKRQLIQALEERDRSIVVLRQLLADKKPKADSQKTKDGNENVVSASQSPSKAPQYGDMPLARLKQIDKARDASIAFLLKQIDTAESRASNEEFTSS
jgi:putative IMPACT (imprinted ancient) family translation regulator